jgi:uncharacterized membrane protein
MAAMPARSRALLPTHSSNGAPALRTPVRVPVPSIGRSSSRPAGARALGVLSAALGLPLLVRPRELLRAIGVPDGRLQTQLAGVVGSRELVAAAGLLSRPGPVWLWGRVAGDAMDLSLLGWASIRSTGERQRRTVLATVAVAGITVIDLLAAIASSRKGKAAAMELTASTTIGMPVEQVYEFWSDLAKLPTFMAHVDEVRPTGPGRSHWRASAPFGRSVEWDAETIEDVPNERISWRSVDGADVDNRGTVRFVAAPGGRGTEVRVELAYRLPAGKLGAAVARYFGEEPHQQLDDDLRRLKQVLETGEVVRSDGAPAGKQARREFPQHPARPLTTEEFEQLTEGARA